MYRLVVGMALVFCIAPTANAQVVFKGPSEAKPNKMTTIILEKVDGDDLKIQGFLNGKPAEAGDWLLMKNLDNQIVIFLMTDREAVFTFVAAVNKTGKTFISTHVIVVGQGTNPQPPPVPTPKVETFGDKLKAAYQKSPEPQNLMKLIVILEEVNSKTYKNYDEMEQVLAFTGKKYLPGNELRSIRDMISDEIVSKCGVRASERDVDKVKAIYAEAITALKTP